MIKLTIKQYATNNQVTTQHVYKLINSGKLEAYDFAVTIKKLFLFFCCL